MNVKLSLVLSVVLFSVCTVLEKPSQRGGALLNRLRLLSDKVFDQRSRTGTKEGKESSVGGPGRCASGHWNICSGK